MSLTPLLHTVMSTALATRIHAIHGQGQMMQPQVLTVKLNLNAKPSLAEVYRLHSHQRYSSAAQSTYSAQATVAVTAAPCWVRPDQTAQKVLVASWTRTLLKVGFSSCTQIIYTYKGQPCIVQAAGFAA